MMLLETKLLTKIYGGLTAVEAVDFSLRQGLVHALIGPNGAGKSTFVGMVSGRTPATSGEVWFDGQNISAWPAHKRMRLGMAYTFQITAIYARLSLFENIALAQGMRDQDAALDALGRVGLDERLDQLAGDLSYGHQRLLEFAMGVAQSPRLLILDEPTQGLSESEIAGFNTLIRSLAGETTILLIEHNMDVVMSLADEVTVLQQGRVLSSGTPETVSADPLVQDAYLGRETC
ncbi:ABC transporter ATP-binding protein [Roseobacter sp. YSTF-M11]|uniref:ABC transporter ATP-binding protein n=1 Tax=Roseobacter insulae TaxID=2859783 RepID=A0A9X1FUT4_9RHOB|nr:ABC transporter ATP-binding protein [Roseobacter insulae]MBW4707515.1 ABC transporter ATP-binding protein [Roseobacter insulae]